MCHRHNLNGFCANLHCLGSIPDFPQGESEGEYVLLNYLHNCYFHILGRRFPEVMLGQQLCRGYPKQKQQLILDVVE